MTMLCTFQVKTFVSVKIIGGRVCGFIHVMLLTEESMDLSYNMGTMLSICNKHIGYCRSDKSWTECCLTYIWSLVMRHISFLFLVYFIHCGVQWIRHWPNNKTVVVCVWGEGWPILVHKSLHIFLFVSCLHYVLWGTVDQALT